MKNHVKRCVYIYIGRPGAQEVDIQLPWLYRQYVLNRAFQGCLRIFTLFGSGTKSVQGSFLFFLGKKMDPFLCSLITMDDVLPVHSTSVLSVY